MKKVMNDKARPIDANEFEVVTLTNRSDEFTEGARYILEMIDEAPTLDYEPVRHEYWIDEGEDPNDLGSGNHQYLCSICNHGDISSKSVKVNYCWFCGAKMRKEEEHDT